MVTDADRLLARGALITLRGEPVRLILTFEALEMLEEEFGGLDAFVDSLRLTGWEKNRIRNVRKAMTAALIHTKPPEQDLIDFEHEIREKMEFRDLTDYLDALVLAVTEAFPEAKIDDDPKGMRSRAISRGKGSTTSRRSATGAANGSSGG
jgi:hypothetical protein